MNLHGLALLAVRLLGRVLEDIFQGPVQFGGQFNRLNVWSVSELCPCLVQEILGGRVRGGYALKGIAKAVRFSVTQLLELRQVNVELEIALSLRMMS